MKTRTFLIIKEATDPGVPAEDRLDLCKRVSSAELAQREVERLSRVEAGQPWRYYWQEWTVETPDE